MAKRAFKWLIVANLIVGLNASAWAQDADSPKSNPSFGARWAEDNDVGQVEYLSSCAACHGLNGKGDGPLSAALKSKPADLTVLAKNNGVFPVNAVFEVVDGRKSVSAHGTREMPIWGFRYMPSPNSPEAFGPTSANKYLNPSYNSEAEVRSRILALVDYLNRIQEK